MDANTRSPEDHPEFFGIVGNLVSDVDLPFDLASGFLLRRASVQEAGLLRDHLTQTDLMFEESAVLPHENHYGASVRDVPAGQRRGSDEWGYFVLHPEALVAPPWPESYAKVVPSPLTMDDRPESMVAVDTFDAGLAVLDRRLALTLGVSWRPAHEEGRRDFDGFCVQHYVTYSTGRRFAGEPLGVDAEFLASARAHMSAFVSVATTHDWLLDASRLYRSLGRLAAGDKLHLLGCVGVLESLLARKQDEKDPIASIGRQLRHKVPLLLRRADRLDEFEEGLDGRGLDRTIRDLYDLRSRVAHGGGVGLARRADRGARTRLVR